MDEQQHRVKRNSGTVLNPRLDPSSLLALMEAQQMHQDNGNRFSHSILIRQAVRMYRDYLKQLKNFDIEVVRITRAAKGIL